jgi:hypothetical protein
MFLFGGMSLNCLNGLCSDLWKLEIPWASMSYWALLMQVRKKIDVKVFRLRAVVLVL